MKNMIYNELSSIQQNLIQEAIKVRQNAYAPYSNYKVGAALVDVNDVIHTGCNVESADYTLTTHAEMVAINSMVKSGVLKLKEIAIVVKSDVGYGLPCGLCRQKIREFSLNLNISIFGVNIDANDNIIDIYYLTLDEMLPYSFGPEFLEKT
jgi:cytidine deaminase